MVTDAIVVVVMVMDGYEDDGGCGDGDGVMTVAAAGR